MGDVLRLDSIEVIRDGRRILGPLQWTVAEGERWLILGANGSGKTTLVRIAALYEHPSTGTVDVLGERLGRTDVRELRRRVGYLSASLAADLRPQLRALDVVMTARYAALEPWWHRYTIVDERHAADRLERLGVGWTAERPWGTLSSGEQQRVLLARTLMNDPAIVLLDEPSARLDLAGREHLVAALEDLANQGPAMALVTHHLDEVPPGMTHVLMLREGAVVTQGPIDTNLTADALSRCFGLELELEQRRDGRWSAWRTTG